MGSNKTHRLPSRTELAWNVDVLWLMRYKKLAIGHPPPSSCAFLYLDT